MKEYLVLGLMPFFKVRAYDADLFRPEATFKNYIRGVRDYGRFQLRPLGLQYENGKNVWDGWSISAHEDGLVSVSARNTVYQLTVVDETIEESDFTDCLVGVQALMYGFAQEEYTLIPIDSGEVPESRVIPIRKAIDMYCRKFGIHPEYEQHSLLFGTKHSGGDEWDERLWQITGFVIGDEQVVYAMLFLRAAFEHLMFYGDDYVRAIRFQESKAQRLKEAVDIENSIHNCYKVMEAVYGGVLANDWRQVEKRFHLHGVNLQQPGGFITPWGVEGEEPLVEKLKRLKVARDDRSAHGRIHANRRSTYFELMDFQMLASIVLQNFVRHKHSAAPI
jgi:hypothetical protein